MKSRGGYIPHGRTTYSHFEEILQSDYMSFYHAVYSRGSAKTPLVLSLCCLVEVINPSFPSWVKHAWVWTAHSLSNLLQVTDQMLARPLIVGQEFEVTVPGEAYGGMGRRNLKTDGGLCTSKNSALFLFMYVLWNPVKSPPIFAMFFTF